MLGWFIVFFLLFLMGCAVYRVLDDAWGTPFEEQDVSVFDRKYNPASSIGPSDAVPEQWVLMVGDKKDGGYVPVSEEQYQAIHNGQRLRVRGKQGRWSGKWHLKRVVSILNP